LFNRFDNRLNVCLHDAGYCSTGCHTVPIEQLVEQLAKQTFNRLFNRFDNWLYRVNGLTLFISTKSILMEVGLLWHVWLLLFVARVFVLAMTAIGIAWIPIVQHFSELFHYIQNVTSCLAPPICAIYLLAVLWRRTNEQVFVVFDTH